MIITLLRQLNILLKKRNTDNEIYNSGIEEFPHSFFAEIG